MKNQVPCAAVQQLSKSEGFHGWPGEHGDGWREKPSANGRWFGWVPSLGPHLHVSVTTVRWFGSWMHAHKTLRHGMAWLGRPFLPNSSLSLLPSCKIRSPTWGLSCLRPLPGCTVWMDAYALLVTLIASIIGLQGQSKLFSFGAPLACGLQNTWIVWVANASGMGPKYYD